MGDRIEQLMMDADEGHNPSVISEEQKGESSDQNSSSHESDYYSSRKSTKTFKDEHIDFGNSLQILPTFNNERPRSGVSRKSSTFKQIYENLEQASSKGDINKDMNLSESRSSSSFSSSQTSQEESSGEEVKIPFERTRKNSTQVIKCPAILGKLLHISNLNF